MSRRPDTAFWTVLGLVGGLYVLLIVLMLSADVLYTTPGHLLEALRSREIRFAIWMSLFSSLGSAALSILVAVPLGYALSRADFPGRRLIDALVEIPIILPPLVVGISLLILFQRPLLKDLGVTYEVPSVIIAQFAVAAAFAVRTMKITFDQMSPRTEWVAQTLGCTRAEAFVRVTLPEARRGILTATTLAWARSIGEFGPVLVFSGATRLKTEVLATTVFLELSVGRLEAAVAVSLLMVVMAVAVLLVVRRYGVRP
ncbi:MAG TPA: ABC transporter permease [Planctomycetota bacterium]